ncbi:MAG: Cyclic di-GMP phosphodiesterase [bacterium]|nr:Cyclic di-GMP phosphodiesterase [bacterium]
MVVLVVDDELDMEMLFQQKFRREIKQGKFAFAFAHSGEEALRFLEGHGATELVLILSDINMPGMTGIELLKRIKEKYGKQKVFLVTAYGDEYNYQQAIAAGADDFVNKPIDFEVLKTRMYQVLGIS